MPENDRIDLTYLESLLVLCRKQGVSEFVDGPLHIALSPVVPTQVQAPQSQTEHVPTLAETLFWSGGAPEPTPKPVPDPDLPLLSRGNS